MKESIGGTTLFMIVIFFIVVFTGYLCFSINQSRAFAVKSGIVRIIERYGAVNHITDPAQFSSGSVVPSNVQQAFKADVTNELKNIGYRTRGNCGNGWVSFGVDGSVVQDGEGVFCVQIIKANTSANPTNSPSAALHYFKIKTFYHFDLPGMRNWFNMTVEGNTKSMQ